MFGKRWFFCSEVPLVGSQRGLFSCQCWQVTFRSKAERVHFNSKYTCENGIAANVDFDRIAHMQQFDPYTPSPRSRACLTVPTVRIVRTVVAAVGKVKRLPLSHRATDGSQIKGSCKVFK